MAFPKAFILFGDQSSSIHDGLAEFCRGKPGVLARHFLEEVSIALRAEVDQLPRTTRLDIPYFRTIQQLNQAYVRSTVRCAAVESALLVSLQVAQYVDRFERFPEDITVVPDTTLVGLCTGLLSAAAVSLSASASSMIPLAVQVVLIAFRVGSHVSKWAQQLDSNNGISNNWTYVIPGVDELRATVMLKECCKGKIIPCMAEMYISAISSCSIAVSGPPPILTALLQSGALDIKPIPIPVFGPYHAAHLHEGVDLDTLAGLNESPMAEIMASASPRMSLLSSSSGEDLSGHSARDIFRLVIRDILIERLDTTKIFHACAQQALAAGVKECLLVPFGATTTANSFATMLKKNAGCDVIIRHNGTKSRSISSGIGDHGSSTGGKLAIVGMAGRFPDAASHELLWELLERGLDVHRVVPADRFDATSHVDISGKGRNKSHTPFGCWIENPGLFDPRFFNMSPREAYQTCPMQRLALSTCYEALEMSGYVPNRTRSTQLDRIGTFYGQTSDDWREINAAQDVDTYFITGGVRAFGPGRINYHFGFSGPSFSIDTACSSSMAAMQLACTSLWAKDCDTAIVGGMSCMTNSDIFSGLSKGQFLSKTGPCATFDNDADGYCRADGVGTVIVKRLEDALADRDNILGVILGTATNHSADAISITHPHGPTQEILYKTILNQAGIDPLEVNYVEMHGTGTQAGDGTEMVSVTNVFAPSDNKRAADNPLYLGAIKANVGHGEAASGVTAIIKCLMMLQKNIIPPHVGIKGEINKTFPADLSDRNVNIAFHKTPLRGVGGKPRIIYISNFSAAGGNSGLLLEDAPKIPKSGPDPRPSHVIAISAKSKSAMLRNMESLAIFLEKHPHTALEDLAYTTTARRIQHNWRTTIVGTSIHQVKTALLAKANETYTPIAQVAPRVAMLFTGQGSQYIGLGKDLFDNSASFRTILISYNDIAQRHGFASFLALVDGSAPDAQTLNPVIVQIGMVCVQMALFSLWTSYGVIPSLVCGHSLGEYAALYAAGVLTASDTIYLVGTRAELLVKLCSSGSHAMLAVKSGAPAIFRVLGGTTLNIACLNSEQETVISGAAAEIDKAANELSEAGLKSTVLQVPYAFHSSQVDPILDEFERIAEAVTFSAPTTKIASPLAGRVLEVGETIDASYLRRHARQAVNFQSALESARSTDLADEKTIWLEIGPHPVCLGMVRSTFGSSTLGAASLRRNENALATLSNAASLLFVAGIEIDWNEFHHDYVKHVRMLDLPSYSFDDKNYWLQYTGDWCLAKGIVATTPQDTPVLVKPTLSTSSVHKIMEEKVEGKATATITIETDFARPDLRAAVMGHLVNGAGLCPSSIYADMSITVCDYVYRLLRPKQVESIGINVSHMEVTKPFLADLKAASQPLRMTTTVNLATNSAQVRFFTVTPKQEHATCTVLFGDNASWLSEWSRTAYLIKGRVDALKAMEQNGKASKIGRGLAYKLFSALVDYGPQYRGMEEVILADEMEATSKVKFQTTPADGEFHLSPYWIDSVAHISGFIVNGSDAVDSSKQVYVSHGWETLRVAEPLSQDKEYRSYVKMQPTTGTMVAGDVYVFHEDRIVAVVGQLKFARIPRSLLNTFLPPIGATKCTPGAPAKQSVLHKAGPNLSAISQVTMKNLQSVNKRLTAPKSASSVISEVMGILAKEIGVDIDELVDNIAFSDLGVDSLMSLTVSGRLREELEIEIDSHQFNDYPTIGAFKKLLLTFERPISPASTAESGSGDLLDGTTPDLDETSPITTPDESTYQGSKDSLSELIRTTIAEEMGVEADEIADHSDLTTMGMDSLMSLTILGKLRELTGMDLPTDLFTHNSTILEIESALNIGKTVRAPPLLMPQPIATVPRTNIEHANIVTAIKTTTSLDYRATRVERNATSNLLQGKLSTATKQLWMVPDGGGSATSYIEIPTLIPTMVVWGLNSPYLRTPEEFNNGVDGIATRYIHEMKRRQPIGPYLLAGWSAGGVIAFEIVVQLLKAGDEVEHLLLLDAPCPLTIEPLPSSLHRWFASIGLLGDGDMSKLPTWLLPHFASSVTALSNYTGEKIDPTRCPLVTIIWCEDGVCKFPEDPRPDPFPYGHAEFLLCNRTDFGPNVWDAYIPLDKMAIKQMTGNHFSMMRGEEAKTLGKLMREGLQRER